MSSSPSSVKQRSPKRTSPKRTPLREQTQSQANEISSRVSRDARSDPENFSVYNATPFPTKAAHVLLPSSIKKSKTGSSPLPDVFGFPFESDVGRVHEGRGTLRGGVQPQVRLKRSVKALRDLYESQAEDSSRPATATSPPLRPSTANSGRLRSIGSNESLSGAYAWESLRKISSDDLALLPTLPSGGRRVQRLSSRSSFTSLAEKAAATSSPNFRVLGVSSSPRPPTFNNATRPVLEPFEESLAESPPNTYNVGPDSSSSPNVIRLARSSSTAQFQSTDQSSSSPNVIKLGTSSPMAVRSGLSDYASPSRSSSTSSRKRKRFDVSSGGRSFADRLALASSPPVDRYVPTSAAASIFSPQGQGVLSSAPQSIRHVESSGDEESSPLPHAWTTRESSSDGISLSDTHASLQAALSSSPPRIQYPVVRAPPISQHAGLVVPKRTSRSMSTEMEGPGFRSRLSAVPSEGSWVNTRPTSDASSADLDDLDEYLNSDELAPASHYIIHQTANQTQIRLVRDSESDVLHEATDAVSALPSSEHVYRPTPQLRHTRSGSYTIGSSNPSQSRLNSMKSFTQSRRSSFMSTSLRPGSSGSTATNIAVPLPTWAKRYYSGLYRDSFNYLYTSGSHVDLRNLAGTNANALVAARSRPDTSRSRPHSPTRRQVQQAITALFRPKPRLNRADARRSHSTPGIGPLVSNPIREPATAALEGRRQSLPANQQAATTHARSFSAPLSPADPRAHWNGVVAEIHQHPFAHGGGSTYVIRHHHVRSSSFSHSVSQSESGDGSIIYHPGGQPGRARWSTSPHLHHDNRLNTGSSASRGFGHPFNVRGRWTAPSISGEEGSRLTLRSVQVLCFAAGFLFPIVWFVAAFLPLPQRPASYGDLEKRAHQRQATTSTLRRPSYRRPAADDASDWESVDVLARLQTERRLAGAAELTWQNARWWRRLNRCMCAVGVVVCAVVVVLAVLGTRRKWS